MVFSLLEVIRSFKTKPRKEGLGIYMLEIDTEIKAFITNYGLRKGIFSSAIFALKRYGVRDARTSSVMTEEEIQNITNISHYTAQTLKEVAHEVLDILLLYIFYEEISVDLLIF